jgi:hypothetical protein
MHVCRMFVPVIVWLILVDLLLVLYECRGMDRGCVRRV